MLHQNNNIKVLIIGSGLGGLSLAQSLRRSGIAFEIFERDNTPFDRPQGYRLHLDEDALNTVREVLTPELQALFQETSQFTEPYTSIMDPKTLKVVKRILTRDDLGSGMWSPPSSSSSTAETETDMKEMPVHANVDRATLRQILLAGMGDSIHFGKKFERYAENPSEANVTAYFADGTSTTGDILVGADGINSRVCRQRAPECCTMDAGVTAIYGQLPIDAVREFGPREAVEDIFVIGSDKRKVFLGMGSVVFPTPPAEAAKKLTEGIEMQARESYAVCIVGGRQEYFPSGDEMAQMASSTLQQTAAELVSAPREGWSSSAAPLVLAGDPESFFVVHMRTSVPDAFQRSGRVTLLGDAIHAMTPSLGRGANLAMRHGCLLGRHLKRVVGGEGSLDKELEGYEREMMDYGFGVVREAARIGRERMGQNLLES